MAARLIILVLGMCFVAFGIALSRQTLLGSSPISTVPTVLSFAFPISIGTFTFFMNLIFLLGQIVVLRKDFSPVQLLQLPFLVFFSAAIDMFVGIVASWPFDTYALRLVWIIVSSFAVALGVYLQSQMRLVMTPGDALVVSIAAVTKKGSPPASLDLT